MSIDLKGNTNYVALRGLPTINPTTGALTTGDYVVPRTALSAVDLIVTGGLSCSGDTLSLDIATSADIEAGTDDKVITADVLKPYLETVQTTLVAGYRMEIISGTTVAQQRYFDIETPTGATVSLQAGHAYRINITQASDAKTLVSEPDNVLNKFGLEGHAEIFVANTGYIHTDESVVFASPLMPNAMNNCTLRFHDGECIISLEDHVYGYIVIQNDNTGEGSLYYALTDASLASQEYVAVSELLAGQTLALANANVTNNKHLIGNGYEDTLIGGTVSVAANKTFKVDAVTLNNVTVTSGTLTLTDAYIPSGVTVSVSGGGLAVEKVTGNGGAVNFGYTTQRISGTASMYASGVMFMSGGIPGTNTGGFTVISGGMMTCVDCTITGFSANAFVVINEVKGSVELTGCTVSGNAGAGALAKYVVGMTQSTLTVRNCTFESNQDIIFTAGAAPANSIILAGSNAMKNAIYPRSASHYGFVNISSGAVLDFTNNANAVVINPGTGGRVIVDGGCTIINSAGASVSIVGGTYTKINKDGTTN